MMIFYVNNINGADSNDGSNHTPFKTVNRALDEVQKIRALNDEDIEIVIAGKYYFGEKPLCSNVETVQKSIYKGIYRKSEIIDTYNFKTAFTILPKHCSHLHKLIINGENADFNGGMRISGFTLFDKENNIYKTKINETVLNARQLYVNGIPAVRARTNEFCDGAEYEHGYQLCNHNSLCNYKNYKDIEFIYYKEWCSYNVPVAGFELKAGRTEKDRILFENEAWKFASVLTSNQTRVQETYDLKYAENALEFLDTEGEFYIDRSSAELYYKPRQNENLETAEIILPAIDRFFSIKGESIDNLCENIEIKGFHFSCSTWLRPNGKMGHLANQSNVIRHESRMGEAALMANYCKNVKVADCKFYNLGSNAIFFVKACSDCEISGNTFHNICGNGIVFISPTPICGGNDDFLKDERYINKNNRINNNLLYNIGTVFPSSVGIVCGVLVNSIISHNELFDIAYSGISLGWHDGAELAEKGNEVSYNRIENTMCSGLGDGGSIYHLGKTAGNKNQSGWLVKGNFLKNHMKHVASIYCDNFSSFIKVTDNVIDNLFSENPKIPHVGYFQGYNIISKDNEFIGNYCTCGGIYDACDMVMIYDDKKTTYNNVEKLITIKEIYNDKNCIKIINNAGLEDDFRHIRSFKYPLNTNHRFNHSLENPTRAWKNNYSLIERTCNERIL